MFSRSRFGLLRAGGASDTQANVCIMNDVGGSSIVVHIVARASHASRDCLDKKRVTSSWRGKDSIRDYSRLPLQNVIESELKKSGLEPPDSLFYGGVNGWVFESS